MSTKNIQRSFPLVKDECPVPCCGHVVRSTTRTEAETALAHHYIHAHMSKGNRA